MAVVLPPRSKVETIVSFPRQAVLAARIYRRTPPRLRRSEPAARLGVAVAAAWFTVLYTCLAISAHRTSAGTATATGYVVAALLGPIGCALFLTRRQRAGLIVLGGMLAVGQIVAVASTMAT